MKVLLVGQNAKNIEKLVSSSQLEITSSNPDTIITYGGDGTLLASERQYPGIPKLPIRDSLVCVKCSNHDEKELLKKLAGGKLKLKEYQKLETTIFYQTLYALNDFVVRNVKPIHTIRFKVSPLGEKLLIGDGIVVSTPFGSTGYFKSITQKTFDKGFGLALNNTTEQFNPLFLKEGESITCKLLRGAATLSFDNNPDIFNIDEGSELVFKLSDQTARIYELESLRCPDCKIMRG